MSSVRTDDWAYYIVPLVLGGMLLWRLAPIGNWIARWPLAFIIGSTAGIPATLDRRRLPVVEDGTSMRVERGDRLALLPHGRQDPRLEQKHLRRRYARQMKAVARRGLREGRRITWHGRNVLYPRYLESYARAERSSQTGTLIRSSLQAVSVSSTLAA